MWIDMFAKLIIASLIFVSFSVTAQNAPVEFQSIKAASQWFGKVYPAHEIKHYKIKGSEGDTEEMYVIYGPRGSGFVRSDAWFYSCFNGSVCGLIAMTTLSGIKEDPVITYESPYLVVRSGNNILLKIKGE